MVLSLSSAQVRFETADLGEMTAPEFKELLARSAAAFGRVDVLFANAGFGQSKLVVDADVSKNDVAEKDECVHVACDYTPS